MYMETQYKMPSHVNEWAPAVVFGLTHLETVLRTVSTKTTKTLPHRLECCDAAGAVDEILTDLPGQARQFLIFFVRKTGIGSPTFQYGTSGRKLEKSSVPRNLVE